MLRFSRVLSVLVLVAVAAVPLDAVPAAAQAGPAPTGQTSTVRVTGVARDQQGAPIAGATINLTGPRTYTTTTDARGAFAIPAQPGVYTLTARKGGYNVADEPDLVIAPGSGDLTANVTLAQTTFTSLREIGRVSTSVSRSGSRFNVSPASIATVTRAQFEDQDQAQVMRLLDETPGIVTGHPNGTANAAAPGAITVPNIRGGLSFETQGLFDGHPLSVGRFGNYVTTFLDSEVFQSVEVAKGPGVTVPVINYAVNGSVNFRTLDPTAARRYFVRLGTDSFGGTNFAARTTGTAGRLGYAFVYASDGTPGAVTDTSAYATLPGGVRITGVDQNGKPVDGFTAGFNTGNTPVAGAGAVPANPYAGYFNRGNVNPYANLVVCCQTIGSQYNVRNELVKLRWNFNPSTSLTASYFGSQAYANQAGNNFTQQSDIFAPALGANGYQSPVGAPFVPGGLFSLYTSGGGLNFGPRSEETNNEPIFQAEFRTALGRDNVIARGYTASISRLIYNQLQGGNDPFVTTGQLYGTTNVVLAPGATCPNPLLANGQCPVAFNGQANAVGFVPAGTAAASGPIAGSPAYFRQTEEDHLRGTSAEYDHFLNHFDDVLALSYDTYRSETHYGTKSGYTLQNGVPAPNNVENIPTGAYQRNGSLQVRLSGTRGKLSASLSNYFSTFFTHAGYTDQTSGTALTSFQDYNASHWDPRLALSWRANRDTSIRFSAGSSIASPYINLFTGTLRTPAQVCANASAAGCQSQIVIARQPFDLRPETAFGYDLGADFRTPNGTLLSVDAYHTSLYNQLIGSALLDTGTTFTPAASPQVPNPVAVPVFYSFAQNLARANYEGLEMSARRDPDEGFGYSANLSLIRAYPLNVPANFFRSSATNQYGTNLAVVPGLNYQGGGSGFNAVGNTAIPYAQAFGELHVRDGRQGLLELGTTYYGKNNSYLRNPFFLFNLTARARFIDRNTTIQLSGDNILNFGGGQTFVQGFALDQPSQVLAGPNPGALSNANAVIPRQYRLTIRRAWGG